MQLTLDHLRQALVKAKLTEQDLLFEGDELAAVKAEIHMLTNLINIIKAD